VTVHAETQVVITMKALLAGAATFIVVGAGVLWGILSFTVGGIKDDVSDIRSSIQRLNGADKDNVQRANEINIRLTDQIQGLRTDFVKYSERFDALSTKLDGAAKSIDALGNRMDKFQAVLAYAETAWSDPKRINQIAETLKQSGATSVIIVPFGAAPPVPQQ